MILPSGYAELSKSNFQKNGPGKRRGKSDPYFNILLNVVESKGS